jgi:hypothetical protein
MTFRARYRAWPIRHLIGANRYAALGARASAEESVRKPTFSGLEADGSE